jgi:hypothetical protein
LKPKQRSILHSKDKKISQIMNYRKVQWMVARPNSLNIGSFEKKLKSCNPWKETMMKKSLSNKWNKIMTANLKIIDFIWKVCLKNQFQVFSFSSKSTALNYTKKMSFLNSRNSSHMVRHWQSEYQWDGKIWPLRKNCLIKECLKKQENNIKRKWMSLDSKTWRCFEILKR